MSERDNNNQVQKQRRSKLKIAAVVLGTIFNVIAAIVGYQIWSVHRPEYYTSDAIWTDARKLIMFALGGCGFYMLAFMDNLRIKKSHRSTMFCVYVLLLMLVALFWYFITHFIDEWI